MKAIKLHLITLVSVGLLFLGACSQGEKASEQNNSPTSNPAASQTAASPANASPAATAKTEHPKTSQGGQVVESGAYHLEFLTQKEATGTHLDLYVKKEINANQFPTPKSSLKYSYRMENNKPLELKYDPEGKHYYGTFPGTEAGQYPVKVTANINGEKVDGRFNFSQ